MDDISQFNMLKQLELSYDDFAKIKNHCVEIGLQFLSTPDTEEDMDFLLGLGMPLLKIGSGEVTNIPFLRAIGQRHQRVILSTGMSTLSDVEIAYNTILDSGATDVSLLHCTTNYPCPYEEVNLRAMQTLKAAFKCRVGYSDHTMGIEVSIAAVAMGAEIIEKHFTLDRTMEGPDHKASLEPDELKEMVCAIRHLEAAFGDGIKKVSKSEKENIKIARKSIVAKTDILKGDILTEANITVKRPGNGINPMKWHEVLGTKAIHDFKEDQLIELQ